MDADEAIDCLVAKTRGAYFTQTNIRDLRMMGWAFVPTGPNEWAWMKYNLDVTGHVAVQGDETWKKDVKEIRHGQS